MEVVSQSLIVPAGVFRDPNIQKMQQRQEEMRRVREEIERQQEEEYAKQEQEKGRLFVHVFVSSNMFFACVSFFDAYFN